MSITEIVGLVALIGVLVAALANSPPSKKYVVPFLQQVTQWFPRWPRGVKVLLGILVGAGIIVALWQFVPALEWGRRFWETFTREPVGWQIVYLATVGFMLLSIVRLSPYKWVRPGLTLLLLVVLARVVWGLASPQIGAMAGVKVVSLEPYRGLPPGWTDSMKPTLEGDLLVTAPFDQEISATLRKGDTIVVEATTVGYVWDPRADGLVGPCGAAWTPRQLPYRAKFPLKDYGIAGVVLKLSDGGYIGLCGTDPGSYLDKFKVVSSFRVLEDADRFILALNERQDRAAYADNSGRITFRVWAMRG